MTPFWILDFGFSIKGKRMNKTVWLQWLESFSDNLKSKTCTEPSRSIENRKLVGIVALVFTLAMCGAVALAQQPTRIPRIGYISGTGNETNQGPYVEALRDGLRKLGYIEDKTFTIEYRGAEGKSDRIPTLVSELINLPVDVLIAPILPAILAAKQATKTTPIVMVASVDPVGSKLVDNLARPGANLTGISTLGPRFKWEAVGVAYRANSSALKGRRPSRCGQSELSDSIRGVSGLGARPKT
jgi:ABC transporter substrate binding protein